MKVHVKNSTIIRPAQETPKHRLRCSDLDLTLPAVHSHHVIFYRRPANTSNFFEGDLLKKALSDVLVPFYPVAGRLERDKNGRFEIDCNGEGVLFLEAETSCTIDDLGDFESSVELMNLFPAVNSTENISSLPLLIIQVTHLKCGGVCLGFMFHHTLADGTSAFHFLNSWAETARGVPVSIPPFFDRSFIENGIPISPSFPHSEFGSYPSMKTPPNKNLGSISTAILKLSPEQINILREISKKDDESTIRSTRFAIVAAHIWRCACKARGLSNDQATKLHLPTNGRFRLNPSNTHGYVGNAVFSCAQETLSGDILSEPLSHTAERIDKAIKHMDEKYLKSALAYLKQHPDVTVFRRGGHTYRCPNLLISKLVGMPVYGTDFGWGPPIFDRLVNADWDGEVYVYPGPANDGSWIVIIELETDHLKQFKKLFYDIFLQYPNVRSRY